MKNNDVKRLSRLTAILIQLQTKPIVTSTALAEKFGISIRTVYRDMKALEQAGVPLVTEDGKGYSLMEGYKLPPVMFSESEANALITVEQLVLRNRDGSLIKEYTEAVNKVKAVLQYSAKEKTELLSKRVAVSPAISQEITSHSLALVQKALTNFSVLNITYQDGQRDKKNSTTGRAVCLILQLAGKLGINCFLQAEKRLQDVPAGQNCQARANGIKISSP